jgi:hypothetical protein
MVYNARVPYCSSSTFKLGLSVSGMPALTHLQLCTDWLKDDGYYGTGAGSDPSALDIQPLLVKLPTTLQVRLRAGCQQYRRSSIDEVHDKHGVTLYHTDLHQGWNQHHCGLASKHSRKPES